MPDVPDYASKWAKTQNWQGWKWIQNLCRQEQARQINQEEVSKDKDGDGVQQNVYFHKDVFDELVTVDICVEWSRVDDDGNEWYFNRMREYIRSWQWWSEWNDQKNNVDEGDEEEEEDEGDEEEDTCRAWRKHVDIPLILRHSSCLRDHHERDDRDVDDRDVDDRDGGVDVNGDGDGKLLMMMRTN